MKRLIFSAALFVMCIFTAQAQKFALIDMEFILKHIPAYEQANQEMASLSKQWQSEIEAKSNEAKTLYEAYQKEAASLSDTQRTQKEEAVVAKEKEAAELRQKYFGPQGEMMKKVFRSSRRNDEKATRTDCTYPRPDIQCCKGNCHSQKLRCGYRPRFGTKHDFCLSAH